MLRQCSQATLHASLTTSLSPLTPILGHPDFSPGLSPTGFQTFGDSNCISAFRFLMGNRWPAISELMDPAGPFHLMFWSAAQIHHFLHSIPNPQIYTQLTSFEEYCSGTDPLPQVLSKTYALLNTPPRQPPLPCIAKSETDLSHTFTETQKQNMIRFSLKSSQCTKIQETNFKILTRWYLTPSRLHAIFPDTPNYCWRFVRGK